MTFSARRIGLAGTAALLLTLAACSGSTKTVPGPTITVQRTTTETAPAPQPVTVTVTATPIVNRVVATKTRTIRVTYTPPPPKSFGDGTYVVGVDVQPGTYHSDGGQGYCAWIRASDKEGSNIIDLGNTSNGPLTVEVQPSDGSLKIQGSCTFHKA